MHTKPLDTVPLSVAAQRLGVPWHTAHKLVMTQCLQGELVGGRWQINAQSLADFIGIQKDDSIPSNR